MILATWRRTQDSQSTELFPPLEAEMSKGESLSVVAGPATIRFEGLTNQQLSFTQAAPTS